MSIILMFGGVCVMAAVIHELLDTMGQQKYSKYLAIVVVAVLLAAALWHVVDAISRVAVLFRLW